jgi:hypothetical protein
LAERITAAGAALPPSERRVAATLPTGRGVPGLFASHATTLVLIEAIVLRVDSP